MPIPPAKKFAIRTSEPISQDRHLRNRNRLEPLEPFARELPCRTRYVAGHCLRKAAYSAKLRPNTTLDGQIGFLIYELATVPEPPQEYRHQQGSMTIVGYLVEEGAEIAAGTPIAMLENWWARFELTCLAPGRVAKNLFDSALGIAVPDSDQLPLLGSGPPPEAEAAVRTPAPFGSAAEAVR